MAILKGVYMSFELNDEEKKFLLALARKTILDHFHEDKASRSDYFSENLKESCGVFVTLEKQANLRGCIGYVEGYKPLQDAVQDNALSAAFRDPRFPLLQEDELDEIEIEISVLTPLEKVEDVDEIKVGRDGLLIKKDHYQGLLLPQVAADWGWDRVQFLEQTCRKAGLPHNAWLDENTEIEKFSALVFSEQSYANNK
jgi:AmmeMemoRadiSam system protein A